MCKIQGQRSSLVSLCTGRGLLTGSPPGSGPLAEELLVAGWVGLFYGAGETPYGGACISAWRKKSWMLAGWWRKQDPCHSHVACCFIHLLVTWYPPVPSSATVLFLDSKSLPSTGVGSVERGEMVIGFETLLPKQPFSLSVCFAMVFCLFKRQATPTPTPLPHHMAPTTIWDLQHFCCLLPRGSCSIF